MAVRKHLSHDTRTREKIRTGQLINRLEKFVLGEGAIELTPAQVTAALGLIKKTLPDLQATTLDAKFEGNMNVKGELSWKPPQ